MIGVFCCKVFHASFKMRSENVSLEAHVKGIRSLGFQGTCFTVCDLLACRLLVTQDCKGRLLLVYLHTFIRLPRSNRSGLGVAAVAPS